MKWITFIFCFTILKLYSQTIEFLPTFNGEKLELEKSYFDFETKDSININRLQFYISNITVYNKNNDSFELDKKHHLLQYNQPETFVIEVDNQIVDSLKKVSFKLGIDSITNVSGAIGGDLDPTNGMYWSWQSGYINFKLEGNSAAVEARKNKFQYHLGGYSSPFKNVVQVKLDLNNLDSVKIELPIESILKQINIIELHTVMSPSANAVRISEIIGNALFIRE